MIGIIGAMVEEVAQIVEVMTIEKEENKAQMNFKQGKLNGKDVVVVRKWYWQGQCCRMYTGACR